MKRPVMTLPLLDLINAVHAAAHAAALETRSAPAVHVLPAPEQREFRAELTPRRFTTLAAEIGGRISHIAVAEGGRFKAGQVLVSLDSAMQQGRLQQARAALEAADQAFNASRRLEQQNAIDKAELDVAASAVSTARADVEANAVILSKCTINAPFSGRVAAQMAREQQYVQPGEPLLDILDDSVLELEFTVPSHWLAWLKTGATFTVRIDETGKAYPASIARIGARVDPVSQSVKLSAVIDGKFPELISGMSARFELIPPGGA